MIGFLRGRLAVVKDGAVILDVGGVGYRVLVPDSLLNKLPQKGEELNLFTHLIVREDGIQLFGFVDHNELEIFIKLLGVSGIGPKAAMALVSKLTPDEFYRAVSEEKVSLLTRVPGIGSKTARRIILDLKDSIDKDFKKSLPSEERRPVEAGVRDAEAALVSLGYSRSESRQVLQQAMEDANVARKEIGVEELIKAALKRLGREQSGG